MKRVSKAQWIQAAVDIFETEGIAGVRVEVLAKKLGISRSGFYWHFQGQEELFAEILNYWAHEITEVLATNPEVSALPPKDRLTTIAQTIVDYDLARYEAAVLQWAMHDENAARMVRKITRMRLDFVGKAFEELGFSGDDLEARTRIFTCNVTWEGPMYRDIPRKRRRGIIDKQVKLLTRK